jgi:hypothetical protein
VCSRVELFASGRSLVQRSPTECGVSECYLEISTMKRPWPTWGCLPMGKTENEKEMLNNRLYRYQVQHCARLVARPPIGIGNLTLSS